MKLKLDDKGNVALQDGKPVYVHEDGKEIPFDAPAAMAKISALNAESDEKKRVAIFADLQKLIFDEAPFYKVGDFAALSAKAPRLAGYTASPWPYFWNVTLKK